MRVFFACLGEVGARLPLQRALREYGPYLPVIFLLWLASGAYFQWRFGVATPGV